jgi:hypothetical protein
MEAINTAVKNTAPPLLEIRYRKYSTGGIFPGKRKGGEHTTPSIMRAEKNTVLRKMTAAAASVSFTL